MQDIIHYYVDFNHIVSKTNLLKRCEANHSSVHKPPWLPNTKEKQESFFCVPTLLYQVPDLSASFLFPHSSTQTLSHHSVLVALFLTPNALFHTMACSLPLCSNIFVVLPLYLLHHHIIYLLTSLILSVFSFLLMAVCVHPV